MSKKDKFTAKPAITDAEASREYDDAMYGSKPMSEEAANHLRKKIQNLKAPAANAILPQQDGSLSFYGYRLTSIGIKTLDGLQPEQWQELGHVLANLQSGIQWLIGDWATHGENVQYGDRTIIAELVGLTQETVWQYAYVARSVEYSIRIEGLSFAHHQVVASMKPEQQRYWLDIASTQGLSVAKLRKAIKNARNQEQPQDMPQPLDQWRKAKPKADTIQAIYRQADERTRELILEELRDLVRTLEGEAGNIQAAHLPQRRSRADIKAFAPDTTEHDQPTQLRDNQLKVLLRLYQKGPISDAYHTNHMTIARELETLGFAKIEQHGTGYMAYIVRRGEQHLRDIGEIVG